MKSERTAIVVSLIIGLAIGLAALMVLWGCAACFSKSRTKDEDQAEVPEATRIEQPYQQDAVVGLPETGKGSSKYERGTYAAAHPPARKETKPSANNAVQYYPPAATPPPLPQSDVAPPGANGSPYPMVSPDPLPTRLSNHIAALPTPSPTAPARGGRKVFSPSPSPEERDDRAYHVPAPIAIPAPALDVASPPRKSSPVIATVVTPSTVAEGLDSEAQAPQVAASVRKSKNKKRTGPSLAELDPMVAVHTQSQGFPEAPAQPPTPEDSDTGIAPPPAVPVLNLDSITEDRNKRHKSANRRPYTLAPEASVPGTTAEMDPISPVPGLPHSISHSERKDISKTPAPQKPFDSSKSLGISGAQGSTCSTFVPPEAAEDRLGAPHWPADVLDGPTKSREVMPSQYQEAADTVAMTKVVGDQTAMVIMGGGPRKGAGSTLPGVQEITGSTGATDSLPPGAVVLGRDTYLDQRMSKPSGQATGNVALPGVYTHSATTGIFAPSREDGDQGAHHDGGKSGGTYMPRVLEDTSTTAASIGATTDNLPPGAIVRGRDMYLDQRMTKSPGQATGSIAQPAKFAHNDTTGIFASPWEHIEQGPRRGVDGGGATGGFGSAGTYTPADSASLISGGSGMSTWTLSSHVRPRSGRRSAFSTMQTSSRSSRRSGRNQYMAPTSSGNSTWTGGDKSNWTLSGGDKSNFMMGGDQSNWTLSGGNTAQFGGTTRHVATRTLEDGRSEGMTLGFTEATSEWGLSPRTMTARDDVDVGHSEPWLQADEIVMPSRLTGARDVDQEHAGLRQQYEQRKLRQQYAADDTTVPEAALRRVDEWMGDMSDTRDEVVKRLLAQNKGDE